MIRPGNTAEVIERCRGLDGEIQLQRRGDDYEIIYNGVFLMSTYNGASEKAAVSEALSNVTCKEYNRLRVLMGGLGMGYSLREALNCTQVVLVTVVELEPAIIRWNRSVLREVNESALYDPGTELIRSDFKDVLKEKTEVSRENPSERYHLIMVDTDNGSTWLSRPANAFFYGQEGLQLMERCLFPGGVACFWCARREEDLEKQLNEKFSPVYFRKVMEETGKEGCYYLAVKQDK